MKKLLLASLTIIPALSMAASQPAISQTGNCYVFRSEIMVPNGWENVDACDDYKKESSGVTLEAVNARRNSAANWAKKYSKTKTTEIKNTLRKGSGTLTRGGADRVTAGIVDKRETRVTTTLALGTSKSYLLQDERRIDKAEDDISTSRAGISGTATKMERSGELSVSSWSTESDLRESRLETQNISSNLRKALERRQYLSKRGRKEEKEYEYKGISLRKIYRGERLEGDLEN